MVAVHGLNGHWERTWTHSNGKLWLRDFLPSRLRDAGINVRVMSYGFDSRMAFSRNVGSIKFQALTLLDALKTKRTLQTEEMRPLILVAHSTGGMIVKKVITRARTPFW